MANKLFSELLKNEYNGSTSYTVGDIVTYNGSSYACRLNTTGNLPTNITYWALLAEKGDKGDTGNTGPAGAAAEVVTSFGSPTSDLKVASEKLTKDSLDAKEDVANKVTSISGSSTDTQYPSAKLVYDQLALKDTKIDLTKYSNLYAPEGFLINGKIVPSVASNNLTVAIKGLNGNDPSASNPVYCRIGDTIRTITSALSVTRNAGTNWFNAGSAELATIEIDYFVYLGYNAIDGVTIGFSRIPYATLYSDFSTTNTNEKYCAISTITNANAIDNYVNIGRFASILSGGAGYTWTVPTFTSLNLIQRPIFETRILIWTPQHTGFSSNPTVSGLYNIQGRKIFIIYAVSGVGTSNATTYTLTGSPIKTIASISLPLATTYDNGNYSATGEATIDTGGIITFYKSARGAWTNSGGKFAQFSGQYNI